MNEVIIIIIIMNKYGERKKQGRKQVGIDGIRGGEWDP